MEQVCLLAHILVRGHPFKCSLTNCLARAYSLACANYSGRSLTLQSIAIEVLPND